MDRRPCRDYSVYDTSNRKDQREYGTADKARAPSNLSIEGHGI